eukprot:Phypoly_transcript_09580.p1 GENE.Phypoly_transcript_09580~~Phypoly_transcript_09580.p1  ORF type:complete len:252 (+),score=12.31 Phypoly_transcript_09580:453-1208(+)
MIASFPVDSEFLNSVGTHNWWLGEKYDGVRACWDPSSRSLFTRTARTISILPNMVTFLPALSSCDSELWFGRGQFASIHVLVTGAIDLVQWHSLRMLVFDDPSRLLGHEKYESRYKKLLSSISFENPFLIIATRLLCKNSKNLNVRVESLIEEHAEGVILQKVGSPYVPGRSPFLVKLKSSNTEKEAIVVNVGPFVELKLPTGRTFLVPAQNVLLPKIRIGEIVSFTFESNSRMEVKEGKGVLTRQCAWRN